MKTSYYISSLLLALILFCSAGTVDALAQKGPKGSKGDRAETVKAMKRAFFTDELSLSSDEAEAFWPVYNEYSSKLRALRKKSKDSGSAEQSLALKEERVAIEKEYLAEFRKVLPDDKVDKLYAAEKKLKEKLMKEAKKRQGER